MKVILPYDPEIIVQEVYSSGLVPGARFHNSHPLVSRMVKYHILQTMNRASGLNSEQRF